MFLFHRLPFLWRLQARLSAREMLSDALAQLSEGSQAPIPKLTRQVERLARRGVVTVGLLGAAGMVLWWLGALASK